METFLQPKNGSSKQTDIPFKGASSLRRSAVIKQCTDFMFALHNNATADKRPVVLQTCVKKLMNAPFMCPFERRSVTCDVLKHKL